MCPEILPRASRGGLPIILIAAALFCLAYLVHPLFDGILLGVAFAYVGRPIRNLFGRRRRIGSLVAALIMVISISAIFAMAVSEVGSQINWAVAHKGEIVQTVSGFVEALNVPQAMLDELASGVQNAVGMLATLLASLPVFGIGWSVFLGSINFIVSLPVSYFILADGSKLTSAISSVVPLDEMHLQRKYLLRIDEILDGIFMGSIYTAIAGGLSSVIIFYLFGIPRPVAMACVVFFAGLVPFLTWLVFIPPTIYVYYTVGLYDAFLFFTVGSLLVHVAELVIRPYFVSVKSSMHPLLVMVSFLGGGMVAGIGGFFLAPALMGGIIGVYQVKSEEIIERRAREREEAARVGA